MKDKMSKSAERAKYIKSARKDRAWSQSQLATIADVTLRTVQRVERDGAASNETLQGIAQAFDVEVKDLTPSIIREQPKSELAHDRQVYLMPRLLTGQNVTSIVIGSEQFQFAHDDDHDSRSIAAMKDILTLLQTDVVRLYDADAVKRLDVEAELSREIKGLDEYGYFLFGIAREVGNKKSGSKAAVRMCTIFMSHNRSPKIVRDKNHNMLMPTLLSKYAQ